MKIDEFGNDSAKEINNAFNNFCNSFKNESNEIDVNAFREFLNNIGMKNDYIAHFTGKPIRDKCINKDDIINLTIALNVSKTIEEFIAII